MREAGRVDGQRGRLEQHPPPQLKMKVLVGVARVTQFAVEVRAEAVEDRAEEIFFVLGTQPGNANIDGLPVLVTGVRRVLAVAARHGNHGEIVKAGVLLNDVQNVEERRGDGAEVARRAGDEHTKWRTKSARHLSSSMDGRVW
jgi:hypothetical protein